MSLEVCLEEVLAAGERVPLRWYEASPGEQVRALRFSQELSLRCVADEAGVSHADLSRLEAGRRDPRLSTLLRVYAALGFYAAVVPFSLGEEAEELGREQMDERHERLRLGPGGRLAARGAGRRPWPKTDPFGRPF